MSDRVGRGVGRAAVQAIRPRARQWARATVAASALALFAVGAASADGPTDSSVSFLKAYQDPQVGQPTSPPWWSLSLDLAWKLLLIVGLIYVTVWLLRRFMGGAQVGVARTGAINLLETTHLAPNKAVYLLEVGERAILVGATQTQLATLTEITSPVELEALRRRYERPEAPRFGEQLKSLAERFGVAPRDRAATAPFDEERRPVPADLADDDHAATSGAFLIEKIAELQRLRNGSAETRGLE